MAICFPSPFWPGSLFRCQSSARTFSDLATYRFLSPSALAVPRGHHSFRGTLGCLDPSSRLVQTHPVPSKPGKIYTLPLAALLCGPFSFGVCYFGEGPQEALHPSGYTCFYLLRGGSWCSMGRSPQPHQSGLGLGQGENRPPGNDIYSGPNLPPNTSFRLLCSNHWKTMPIPWLWGVGLVLLLLPWAHQAPVGTLVPQALRHTLYYPPCLHTHTALVQWAPFYYTCKITTPIVLCSSSPRPQMWPKPGSKCHRSECPTCPGVEGNT